MEGPSTAFSTFTSAVGSSLHVARLAAAGVSEATSLARAAGAQARATEAGPGSRPLLGTDAGDGNVASVMGDVLVGRVVFSMAKVEGAWCGCGE